MNPTLHAQILTLRKYQAWRTGEDERTMDEAGIQPAAITSAMIAVLDVVTRLTSLTDDDIIRIAKDTKTAEPGRDGYVLPVAFARTLIDHFLDTKKVDT